MAEIYANNVKGKLAEPITSTDTSLPLEAGHSFPDPGNDWYRATLYRWEFTSEGIREFDHEVVKVTGLGGNTLTVERGLEGSAFAYDPETPIEMRLTAATLDNKRDLANTSFPRYDLTSASVTTTLDLAQQQVFRVDASVSRTLAFANVPGSNKAITVIVHITGNNAVTWPTDINWDEGLAPNLGGTFTRVVLIWDGDIWTGNARTRE